MKTQHIAKQQKKKSHSMVKKKPHYTLHIIPVLITAHNATKQHGVKQE